MQSRTEAQDETATVVRNGKCYVKNIRVEQRTTDAPALYLQVFNTNDPTVGTTLPTAVLPVPAGNANRDMAFNEVRCKSEVGGIYMGTGLSYAVTTDSTGNTGPDAGDEPVVVLDYENLG